MNLSRTLVISAVLLVLVTLQFTLRPLLDWRASVDFLLIGVLLVAVRVRPGGAALVGLLFGLVLDAMNPEALGSAALAMTLTAFVASRLKAAFFADALGLNAIFVFGGKVVFDVISIVAEGRLRGGALAFQLLAWTPLSALATAVIGVVVMAMVRPAIDVRRFR
jgi:rod shape-determining protein MreD